MDEVLDQADAPAFYRSIVSCFQDSATIVLCGHEPANVLVDPNIWPALADFRELITALDTLSYLPCDILTIIDRASISASLEGRVPFLDHKLIKWVWRLPFDLKLDRGKTKWALRQVLE